MNNSSENQAMVPQSEEDKEVVKESSKEVVNKAVDLVKEEEEGSGIEGFDSVSGEDKEGKGVELGSEVVGEVEEDRRGSEGFDVREEERDGIVGVRLEKEDVLGVKLEKEEVLGVKLDKEEGLGAGLEKEDLDDEDEEKESDKELENGVSDGGVSEKAETVVQEEKRAEEIEAREEKEDSVPDDENVGLEVDSDEKIHEKDAKIESQIEEEEEELEKSGSIDGGEKGEELKAEIEKDEISLPSVQIESEKVQKEEEIEVPKAEKEAEIEGEEVPNPNPKSSETDEIGGEEAANPNPKSEKTDESEASEVPNPNPNLKPSNTIEEAKPETTEASPVINNGFVKDEVLEGISENKEAKEAEGDSVIIEGENEKVEGISENSEKKEVVESVVNSSNSKGENENVETKEQEGISLNSNENKGENENVETETKGISENNVAKEIKADLSSTEMKGEIENQENEEERENSEIRERKNNFMEFTGDEMDEDEMEDLIAKPARVAILESSDEAKEMMKEIEEDGQIVTDSDEEREYREEEEEEERENEEEEEDEDEEREIFDSDALAALLRAATGTDGNIRINSQEAGTGTGSRVFSFDRPAGLGSSSTVLRPAGTNRSYRPNPNSQLSAVPVEENQEEELSQEEKTLHEKVENIRVKFLRLVYRSGFSPDDTVAAQVLYRLSLAEGMRRGRPGTSRNAGTESARRKALQLEALEEDLDFSCNILVLGKTGVGKSATINSIFGNEVTGTSAFVQATKSVRELTGTVDGIKFRVLDTPGLKTSIMDQNANRKILTSVKNYMKKCPPDIVLYLDRMDTQTRDLNDLPLLRTITNVLGSSIWFNAIVCLTHAGTAPPDGPNGTALTYEVFVAQRSHVVQQMVRQAAGDMRLMNPVSLIENHILCRRNTNGHKVLPNGLAWRQQLLLLCYSSKILSEANGLLKLQDGSNSVASKLFGFRFRSPPLPFLLSSLLQTRVHPKLENGEGNGGDSDLELDDFSDKEEDEEDEYESLPTFKPLKKAQFERLSKDQKRMYFEEYEYRVKLLQKKQWRDEVRRMKEIKRAKENNVNFGTGFGTGTDQNDEFGQDDTPSSVPVPLPDMVLPPSFDSDGPTYRYRFLEPTSGFLARPVLDSHGWDHDVGYDGVSLEETLTLIEKFPANATVQITKDKKEFSIHLESSVSAKHGETGSSLLGFDIQTIGRQLGYIFRGETKLKSFKRNKTTGGLTLTFLGDVMATGAKFEDQITLGKRVTVVCSTGLVKAQGDTAYGANFEARLKDKDYPIGQALTTLGLSLMKWRGDLAIGANLQSQIPVGFGSKVALRVGLNNKLSGQITVRTSTTEQVQIALLGILPVAVSLYRNYLGAGEGFAY